MRDGDAGLQPRRAQVEPGRLLRLLSCVVLVCGAEVAALADFSGTGRAPSDGLPGAGGRGAARGRAEAGTPWAGAGGGCQPPAMPRGDPHRQGRRRGLPARAPHGAAYSPERSLLRDPAAGPCPGPGPAERSRVPGRRQQGGERGVRAPGGAAWEGTRGAEPSLRGGNALRGSAGA